MILLTRDQVRNLDRIAVERYGIPGALLMENAGRGATDSLERRLLGTPGSDVALLCGRGNNGGDGFVIARHLAIRGHHPEILLTAPAESYEGSGEAALNFRIARRMGLPFSVLDSPADARSRLRGRHAVVDALLGTGLTGEVREPLATLIDILGDLEAPVFAVDIPSGLDCDSGLPLGRAVRAAATATFAAMKRGFNQDGAAEYTGPVDVVDIGCPLVWE